MTDLADSPAAVPVVIDPALLERLAGAATQRVVPRATYRLQFNKGFTFQDARRLVPYLAKLGVSHLYASPIFQAVPGSLHGYDVADYGRLNEEIGSEKDFGALTRALDRHSMQLVVDFVPNHMGIAAGSNSWWQDVLEHGPASPYAMFFDIDWQPVKPQLQDQVLLPVLGDHYGIVLENGELQLRLHDGAFTIWYFDLPLPVAPQTYPLILRRPLDDLAEEFAPDDLPFLGYQSIISAFEDLPAGRGLDADAIERRMREQRVTKGRLAQLLAESEPIASAVTRAVAGLNGTTCDARSFDALDALIEAQSYRLAYWRVAAEEINYRRFFAINQLAAIKQEVPEVFTETHRLLLDEISRGRIAGVRIDHPDGLWDPTAYFCDLQRAAFLARARGVFETGSFKGEWAQIEPALARWWDGRLETAADPDGLRAIYLVIEKIVEHGEPVPDDWMIDGTVGYEFAEVAGGLFVDQANQKAFDALYASFAGDLPKFANLVYECKKLILEVALVSELNVLARALDQLSEHHRRTRDFTYEAIRNAMREIIACFPVYRTYVDCLPPAVSDRDRKFVQSAVSEAIRRNPAQERGVFEFVRNILLLESAADLTDQQQAEQCRFVMKAQQLTGPVMAKGLEDTAFYVYNRLASLNEVGGNPGTFGASPSDFHKQNAERALRWPHAMLTSSTHDTKRSEDVRARINALSEMPKEWRTAINRWAKMNRRLKTKVDGALAPDRNDENLFYQTLVGIWPFGATDADNQLTERIEAYMLKAVHEAQVHTSWLNPNEAYDAALSAFVRGALRKEYKAFLDDFSRFHTVIARMGAFNALAQQLLKLTAPGVPDLYQGTELWDFSLVDPDNRREIDFKMRSRLLSEITGHSRDPDLLDDLLSDLSDGRVKLYLTWRVLEFRRKNPELFATGDYTAINSMGASAESVIAFTRQLDNQEVIVIAPRLIGRALAGGATAPVGAIWGNTALALPDRFDGARFRSVLTGASVSATRIDESVTLSLAETLAAFPVALLERVPKRGGADRGPHANGAARGGS